MRGTPVGSVQVVGLLQAISGSAVGLANWTRTKLSPELQLSTIVEAHLQMVSG